MSALDEYLQKVSDEQEMVIKELHNLITENLPFLQYSIKWGALTYHNGSNIFSLVSHNNHINLQFFTGATLTDPENILEGTGKRMRHIKIKNFSDIDTDYLPSLLKEAAEDV